MKSKLTAFLVLSAASLMPYAAHAAPPAPQPSVTYFDHYDGRSLVVYVHVPGLNACNLIINSGNIVSPQDGTQGEIDLSYDPKRVNPKMHCIPGKSFSGVIAIPSAAIPADPAKYIVHLNGRALPASAFLMTSTGPKPDLLAPFSAPPIATIAPAPAVPVGPAAAPAPAVNELKDGVPVAL